VAKFRPGPLVSEIRNALGSQVFSRNQYGAFVRARVDPDNTETPDRATAKAAMTAAADAWNNSLTDADRLAWHATAESAAVKARSPLYTQINGVGLFVKLWLYAHWWSGNFLLAPPQDLLTPPLESIGLTANFDTPELEISFAPSPIPAGQILMVYATPPLNAGVTRPHRWFKPISGLPATTTSPQDLSTEYLNAFNPPAPGQKVFVRAMMMYTYNNMPSGPLQAVASNTGSEYPMLIATVTLTDAQIKALPTTPITVLAGIPNKIILPFKAVIQLDASNGAYGNVSAGIANFLSIFVGQILSTRIANDQVITGATKRHSELSAISLLDAVPPTIAQLSGLSRDPSVYDGIAATIQCTNAAGNFTGGNAANSMIVTLYYMVIDSF
jgi:hypothetical protein